MIFRASRSCSLVRMRPLPWGRPGCFTATAAGPLASYSRLILRTVNWVMPQSSAVAFWVIPFFRQATTCRRRSLSSGMDSFLESFVLMKMRDPRIVPKCYLFSAVSIVRMSHVINSLLSGGRLGHQLDIAFDSLSPIRRKCFPNPRSGAHKRIPALGTAERRGGRLFGAVAHQVGQGLAVALRPFPRGVAHVEQAQAMGVRAEAQELHHGRPGGHGAGAPERAQPQGRAGEVHVLHGAGHGELFFV